MLELIPQFLLCGVRDASVYALIGLGLAVIHRTTEVMFFAQGSLAMVSGVSLYALCTYLKVPALIALLAALLLSVVVALACQWLIVVPLMKRKTTPLSISIVSVGAAFLLEMIAMIMFGKDPYQYPPFLAKRRFLFWGQQFYHKICGSSVPWCFFQVSRFSFLKGPGPVWQ